MEYGWKRTVIVLKEKFFTALPSCAYAKEKTGSVSSLYYEQTV